MSCLAYAEWAVRLLAFVFVFWALSTVLQRRLRATMTALDDLSTLGVSRRDGQKIQGTAVICGGSIAGLLSARICADHFERVIIVEPEAWLATEEGLYDRHREIGTPGSSASRRSRVAQYTAVHVYQLFNDIALQKLFPNYRSEMERAGGLFLPALTEFHLAGVPLLTPYHKYPNGLPDVLHFTRPGYETTLRRLVLTQCPNVRYLTGRVSGLLPNSSRDYVASVLVQNNVGSQGEPFMIPAALVIDCTGPVLGGLKWLHEASFSMSEKQIHPSCLKTSYDPKVAYTTCEFDVSGVLPALKHVLRPIDYDTHGTFHIHLCDAKGDRSMVVIERRENNYLQIMCGGHDFRGRITSISDIKEYISKLILERPIPGHIHALIDFLEKADIPATYCHKRVSPRVLVQYSKAAQLPENFIAIGDSVAQLNPVRGQGCTKACIEAVTLNALLAETIPLTAEDGCDSLPRDFSRKFFSQQARRILPLWDIIKFADYGFDSTVPEPGENPKSTGVFSRWYGRQIVKLATKDSEIAWDFWKTSHFIAPPTDLLWPRTFVKVIWACLREHLGHLNPMPVSS